MKGVLLSVQSPWCAKIANGAKTIEVRKTRPRLEPPFKCYIYCTAAVPFLVLGDVYDGGSFITEYTVTSGRSKADADRIWGVLNGTVIGEFVCDDIKSFGVPYPAFSARMDKEIMARSCLTYDELHRYAMGNCLYAWHISDLQIYDQPKSLKIFRNPCQEYEKDDPQCGNCDYYHSMGEYPAECACEGLKPMLRPPQSWCYVEVIENEV